MNPMRILLFGPMGVFPLVYERRQIAVAGEMHRQLERVRRERVWQTCPTPSQLDNALRVAPHVDDEELAVKRIVPAEEHLRALRSLDGGAKGCRE